MASRLRLVFGPDGVKVALGALAIWTAPARFSVAVFAEECHFFWVMAAGDQWR
jgi:hypothetical protein